MGLATRSESVLLQHRLNNGLQVLGQQIPGVESAAAMFWVKTGARDESPAEGGVSHFLEHMAFKRTETRTGEDINREFEEIGAENNAFTWLEMTAFHSRALGDRLEHMIDLLADLTHPVLDDSDFQQERQVILEEIARHNDQPYSVIMEQFFRTFYPGQPLGTPTLGTTETIEAMTVEDMRSYWQRRYGANNMVFSVAGNFDWNSVLEQLERLTVAWSQVAVDPSPPGRPAAATSVVVADDRWNQEHLVIGIPSIAQGDRHYYAAAVMANLLGDDTGSRLFWSINQSGLADQVGASVFTFADTGALFAIAITDPEQAPRTLAAVRAELEALQTGPIHEDELVRAKMKLLTSTVIEGESTRARMMGLTDSWLAHARLETLEEVQTAIDAVTVEDIKELLERYPLTEGQVLAALGPLSESELN